MIDTLQRLARGARLFRLPALFIACISLVALLLILFFLGSPKQGERYVIPCIVGMLWGLSSYFFLATFQRVPARAKGKMRLWASLRLRIHRLWYWLVGVVFLATTGAALMATLRLFALWLRDYAGS